MTQRTPSQNNALHLWCQQIADELNNEGYDTRAFLAKLPSIDVPITKEIVKDALLRTVGRKMFGKEHTSDWTKAEVDQALDPIIRALGERFGVEVPFPSDEYESDLMAGMAIDVRGVDNYPELDSTNDGSGV